MSTAQSRYVDNTLAGLSRDDVARLVAADPRASLNFVTVEGMVDSHGSTDARLRWAVMLCGLSPVEVASLVVKRLAGVEAVQKAVVAAGSSEVTARWASLLADAAGVDGAEDWPGGWQLGLRDLVFELPEVVEASEPVAEVTHLQAVAS